MSIYDKASLVLIPSGTKTSKVYSQKPVNGDGDFTFSRSTAATRVNADGNIEKETGNLLLQSNSFLTSWVRTGYTLTSGQGGYDGTNNAWLAECTSAGQALYQTSNASGVSTLSFHLKQGTANFLRLRADQSADAIAYFDLSDGSVNSFNGNVIDTNVVDLGSGWYRCSMTWNIDTLSNVQVRAEDGNGSPILGTFYIQDAQLEQGLVARDYIETTTAAVEGGITDNVPRLDYTDSSCPALLLEPQRTNLLTNSEYLNDWSKTAVSVNSNVATSPEGVQNASEFVVTTQQNAEGIAKGFTADGTSDYVVSGYISKNSTAALVALKIRDFLGSGSTHCFVQFSPSTGVVQASIGEYAIESFNDDWWYVWSKPTTTIPSGARNAIIRIDNQSVGTNCIAYGIQVEAGSYATSYIPTYGTSVTRNAEFPVKIANSSSVSGSNAGTMYAEFNVDNIIGQTNDPVILTLKDASNASQAYIQLRDDRKLQSIYNLAVGGIQANISQAAGSISTGTHKVAFAFNDNDFVMYVDGSLVGTDSNGSTTNEFDEVYLGYYSANFNPSAGIKQALLFKTRLSNEELAALTTI